MANLAANVRASSRGGVRLHFLPRTLYEVGSWIFLTAVIHLLYFFETLMVLPSLYERWSFWYTVHLVSASVLLVNTVSALLGVMLLDCAPADLASPASSLPCPSPTCSAVARRRRWRLCDRCGVLVPPRSWHCSKCDVCILTRDHHCTFAGYCVGHRNRRFFILFLVYVAFSCGYAFRYNVHFVWEHLSLRSLRLVLEVVAPAGARLLFLSPADVRVVFSLLMAGITCAGLAVAAPMAVYHIYLVLRGRVSCEDSKKLPDYDQGLCQNLRQVFGKNWYVAWLSPLLPSPLPHRGCCWGPGDAVEPKEDDAKKVL